MRRARCAVVVAVVWSLGLPLLAGEVGLAERLKESVGELGEAYGQLAAQLERAGIPVPPGLTEVLTQLGGQATKAAAALAERPGPDTMRQAREAWERVRFARRLLRRIRRDHADAAELPGAQQQAELWPKMLDVAARAIRSQMANRHIEAMRLEAELDILRLSLGQQREKRELQEEFRAILEFAAEHRGDPRVAAVLADLKARFAALGKAQEMRFQAERAEIKLDVQRHILEAMREEQKRVRRAAEHEFEEIEDEIERLIDRGERLIDQIDEAEEGEDDEDDERPGKAEM